MTSALSRNTRFFISPAALLGLSVVVAYFLSGCTTAQSDSVDLIISDIRLYTEPGVPSLEGVSIAVRDGRIVEISSDITVESKRFLDGGGRAATAGLWNSHVHFTNPALKTDAANIVHDMLLQYGFTSVLDTGSELSETLALLEAIENGEIAGPRIVLANGSFVYVDGTPSYLPGIQLPEIENPEDAEQMVNTFMDAGAQGIKIFAGSFMTRTYTIHLPPEIIASISDAVHDRGGFVVAHPQDRISLINSVENGVDVLAHAAPIPEPLGQSLVETMKRNDVALIPTLKLWTYELLRSGVPERAARAVQNFAVVQLAEYYAAGGEILFGTDTGYMTDFDTKDEFVLMHKAGMNFDGILASLTTNPARRFANESGRLDVGAAADIVIYANDPAKDVAGFSQVQYTIRNGKILFCADEGQADSACQSQRSPNSP